MGLRNRGSEWEEYDNAVKWMAMTMIITLVVTLILTIFSLPMAFLIEKGISKNTIATVKSFLKAVQSNPSFLFQQYYSWMQKLSAGNEFSLGRWLPILPFLSFTVIFPYWSFFINMEPYFSKSSFNSCGISSEKNLTVLQALHHFHGDFPYH